MPVLWFAVRNVQSKQLVNSSTRQLVNFKKKPTKKFCSYGAFCYLCKNKSAQNTLMLYKSL